MQVLSIHNNERYNYKQSFKALTAMQICFEKCGGYCCNKGTQMNPILKKFTDGLFAKYKTMPDNLKSEFLIKTPIIEWVVKSQNPDVIYINALANACIDTISRETDSEKIKKLKAKLDELNDKLYSLLGDTDIFIAVTNPELKESSYFDTATADLNICMYKDHETNLCTIYDGTKDDKGNPVIRPYSCSTVGSDVAPCPWHHPEMYDEICNKTREKLANFGYGVLPMEVIKRYIAKQYNLNEKFIREIWEPYISKLNTSV